MSERDNEVPEQAGEESGESQRAGSGSLVPERQDVIITPAKVPFEGDQSDLVFALISIVFAYLFVRWVLCFDTTGGGLWVGLFGVLYTGAVFLYLARKGFKLSKEPACWLGCILLASLATWLYEDASISFVRFVFIMGCYLCFVVSTTGLARHGIIADGLNAILLVPARNLFNLVKSFGNQKDRKTGSLAVILAGALVGTILILFMMPHFMEVDTGAFRVFVDAFLLDEELFKVLVAIPVAFWQYALISGYAHNRRVHLSPDATGASWRVMSNSFFSSASFVLCAFYVLFLATQVPGIMHLNQNVASYAIRGFEDLCVIVVANLVVITAPKFFSNEPLAKAGASRTINCLLCLFTLLFIALAAFKLYLYIDSFGLTDRRVYPMVFMVFLAISIVLYAASLFRPFDAMKMATILGCTMFCVMILINPNKLILKYNADRYLEGSLKNFDIDLLYRFGSAGVDTAIRLKEDVSASQTKMHEDLNGYLVYMRDAKGERCLEFYRAKDKVEKYLSGLPD